MTRSRWIALIAVIVVIAAAWALRGLGKKDGPKYRTAALERGDVTATVSATGTVEPVVQVQVGSQVSGTLMKRNVDYNSRVKNGEVLGELEPSAFHARLVQAQATVAHAEAALKDGERQLKRAQELAAQNYISQADIETAEVTVEQRKADLLQAKAALDAAQVDLDHTIIRAPIDGVVISRSIDVGQTVAASLQAPQLFVIANDLKQMQVESKIDEADIGRIHPGLPVNFTVDAFPDAIFQGSVSQVRLEPITDQNVVTYTTVISTRNDDLRLRPGMTANVTVLVETKANVLKIANAALRFRPEGAGGPGGGPGRRSVASLLNAFGAAPAYAQPDSSGGAHRWQGAHPPREQGESQGTPGAGQFGGANGWRHGGMSSLPPGYKPGTLYVLKDGKPEAVRVLTGISDGTSTEVMSRDLHEGDLVIIGTELLGAARGNNLQPPPGMGGPGFRPGGGGRR